MLKLRCKLHLILPLLVKFHQNLTRIEKNVVLYATYSKKLPNTLCTSLYLQTYLNPLSS